MFKKIEESTNKQTKYLNIFEAMVNFFKFHENSKPTDPKASMNPKHKKQKSLKSTSRHIITKLFKKFKATREKTLNMKEQIGMIADFSSETMSARRHWSKSISSK